MTDLHKIAELVAELERKDERMREAFEQERLARAEVLSEIWAVVSPVMPIIGASYTAIGRVPGPWHVVATPVVPERGGYRQLHLVLHEDRPDKAMFSVHLPGDHLGIEVVSALAVCEAGHRWRLADVAESLEDLLMRANEGKIERRQKEATERAEVLRATAVLLRRVKG